MVVIEITYEYSNSDLLANPQNYQRSQYKGRSFLDSYKKSRHEILTILKNDHNNSVNELIFNLTPNIDSYIINEFVKQEFETQILLQLLLIKIIKNKEEKNYDYIINKFVTKFEIKKKIYSSYNEEFKQTSTNYSNLKNYILLSLICIKKFKITNNLKYLNVVLKLNDLISSQINSILDKSMRSLCYSVLKNELICISNLCKIKGI